MAANQLIRMFQFANKVIPCCESVKAKMNGSFVTSLDRFLTRYDKCLQVVSSKLFPDNYKNYFLTQTHFNELFLHVTIDLKNTKLIDHSVMENLHHFKHEYESNGGTVRIVGFDKHTSLSDHALAARKRKNIPAESTP